MKLIQCGYIHLHKEIIMLKTSINAIAAQALIDNKFEAAILNGQRKEKLHEFNLSEKQFEAVMAIKADNLDQFIRSLGKLIQIPSAAV